MYTPNCTNIPYIDYFVHFVSSNPLNLDMTRFIPATEPETEQKIVFPLFPISRNKAIVELCLNLSNNTNLKKLLIFVHFVSNSPLPIGTTRFEPATEFILLCSPNIWKYMLFCTAKKYLLILCSVSG